MIEMNERVAELEPLLLFMAVERGLRGPDVDDAVQEALTRAWIRLEQGYSKGIAIHAARQALADFKKGTPSTGNDGRRGDGHVKLKPVPIVRTSAANEEYLDEPAEEEPGYERTMELWSFERLLHPLGDRQRRLLWMRHVWVMSQGEIAAALGITPQAVSKQLAVAHRRIKEAL